nr:ParM/StbA family protein [Candidatus Paceibacterota bacterium]
ILIGDAALKSLTGVTSLSREKSPEIHDLFVLTACYLCGIGSLTPTQNNPTHLAVGLPLAYYRSQKDELKNRLNKLSTLIAVDGGMEKYISFQRVSVFPQGLGVLFSGVSMPRHGFVGLIDIGSFTTDYILFSIEDGKPIPIPDGCGSVEAGTYLIQQDLASAFQSQTGAPLAHFMYAEALQAAMDNKPISFQGKNINLSEAFNQSCVSTTQLIIEAVRSAWVSRGEYLNATMFAGGGSEMLKKHLKSFPSISVVSDPVFANAAGFYKLISS